MRIATFNLLHGARWPSGEVNLNELRTAVRELDADILALQEVDRGQPRSHLADLTALVAEATGAQHWCFLPVLIGEMGQGPRLAARGDEDPDQPAYGLALVSRFPATGWRSHRLPRLSVRYPQRHHESRRLTREPEEPRAALLGEFATPAGRLAVANTHLSFVPGSRRRQLRRLVRRLGPLPDPVLLAGDLNLTAPGPARITRYRPLASRPTFPADHPTRQIDHLLLRGDFGTPALTQTPALPLSDHRALVVELTF